jgi:two-component system chemotaxis response regulator CheY
MTMIETKVILDARTRILVVDDQPFIRNMVKAILKGFGLNDVMTADDGNRAIDMLTEGNFDAVICDWNMPIVTGIDVLKHLRSMGSKSRIPFIMLTAEAYRENIVAALEAGVTDYISKPFTSDILGEKLARAISKAKSQGII